MSDNGLETKFLVVYLLINAELRMSAERFSQITYTFFLLHIIRISLVVEIRLKQNILH